jgi:DNA-binding transcriptional ArsR family regulator
VLRADIREIEGVVQRDFLTTAYTDLDAVIMNPPFKLTPQFVSHALDCVRDGGLVALFQRTQLLEGSDRYKKMWASEQLADFYEHTARVNCYPEGRVDHRHSGMMTFAWFVLRKGHRGPFRGQWIPDRQQDYGVGALLPQQVGMCWWCRLYRESACCSPSPAPKQLTNAMIARLREITDAHELDDRGAHGYNLESLCGSWRARQ